MKSAVKKTVSLLLAAVLTALMCSTALAGQSTASLANVYSDGMLFRQNAPAIFTGSAAPGSTVTAELSIDGGTPLLKAKAAANRSGGFTLSFTAPAGGYKKYTVSFYENGELFRTLSDVVFGELWLSSGQSNMQYNLAASDTYEQNKTGSEWLRFLYVETNPTYQGSQDNYPAEPMADFESGNCKWIKGNSSSTAALSAVTFYFAQALQKKLDMPVGVLAPNLGGSMLSSWLSRETVNSDPVFADYLKEKGQYLDIGFKNEDVNVFTTMTANYNKKIFALRNFRISGMIWYQGESETMSDWADGMYTRGLELLQSSYGEVFACEGKLPFIATQLVPYDYGDNSLALHNDEFVTFAAADLSSRAVTTLYDLSMGYIPDVGSIHPAAKQPIGERMAHCAAGLVYSLNDTFTAAYLDSFKAEGDSITVKFGSVGDGLKAAGDRLYGFSVCDESGIYVQADAEITGKDTVRIHSDEVEKPAAAAYAFSENCGRANLFSTYNGELLMPAAGFTTDKANAKLFFEEPAWASCDFSEAWFTASSDMAGIRNVWNAGNAEITFSADAFDGESCLNLTLDSKPLAKRFYASPTLTYKDGRNTKYYNRLLRDWSNYSSVSVMVRNNGSSDIEVTALRLYTNPAVWFAPEVNMLGEASTVIPADGKWYRLDFDLDRLYLNANECGGVYSRAKLEDISDFRLCFKSTGGTADVSVDEFRFTPDGSEGAGFRFEASPADADNPFEFVCALFIGTIGAIINLFK